MTFSRFLLDVPNYSLTDWYINKCPENVWSIKINSFLIGHFFILTYTQYWLDDKETIGCQYCITISTNNFLSISNFISKSNLTTINSFISTSNFTNNYLTGSAHLITSYILIFYVPSPKSLGTTCYIYSPIHFKIQEYPCLYFYCFDLFRKKYQKEVAVE